MQSEFNETPRRRAGAAGHPPEQSLWLGNLLRDRRTIIGVGLSMMARRARFWPGQLHGLENGQHLPQVRTLRRLARSYELPFGLLLAIRDSAFQKRRRVSLLQAVGQVQRQLTLELRRQRFSRKRQLEISRALRQVKASLDHT